MWSKGRVNLSLSPPPLFAIASYCHAHLINGPLWSGREGGGGRRNVIREKSMQEQWYLFEPEINPVPVQKYAQNTVYDICGQIS